MSLIEGDGMRSGSEQQSWPHGATAAAAAATEFRAVSSAEADVPFRGLWVLRGCRAADGRAEEIRISTAHFNVGRRADMHLCLNCGSVSKHHAVIIATPQAVFVRDLGSTNGTFINGRRVEDTSPIGEGDTIQFAEREFRVSRLIDDADDATRVSSTPDIGWALTQFESLLTGGKLVPWFQPVVALQDAAIVGFEVLARSEVAGLETPAKMFQTAEQLSMEVRLSELSRELGLQHAAELAAPVSIYLNTHPSESPGSQLMGSLARLRETHPQAEIVIELHEGAVAQPKQMNELRAALQDLNMRLAYDDFGAGQSRLRELIAAPPDILKFDMALIKNIHHANSRLRRMVGMLVNVVRDSGVIALAEGVECEGEAEVCCELGFQFGQGWHFGRPAPVAHWSTPAAHVPSTPVE